MPIKPPFGTLNARVSRTLVENAPRYRRIVEPFGDGGTWALELKKRRPKEHVLNIVDPDLFAAMTFAQGASGAQRAELKRFDWVGSQETFDRVMAITATEGPEHFYKFLYVRKLGMRMDPPQPPTFDVLSEGKDISPLLYGLPLMKIGLKGVRIVTEEPAATMGGASGADTFLILLPKTPEHVELVLSRLSSLTASVFAAVKVPGAEEAFVLAERFRQQKVSVITAPSIMMAKMATVSNYENKLTPLDPTKRMKMPATAPTGVRWRRVHRAAAENAPLHYYRLLREAAGRVLRREAAALSKAAQRHGGDAVAWEGAVQDFYVEHESYVAAALQMSAGRARRYCAQQRAELLTEGANALRNWEDERVGLLMALAREGEERVEALTLAGGKNG